MGLFHSVIRNQDLVMNYANSVDYPFLMVIAEKDALVNNKINRKWYDQTISKEKEMRLMPGAYHETTKEPTNHTIFRGDPQVHGQENFKGRQSCRRSPYCQVCDQDTFIEAQEVLAASPNRVPFHRPTDLHHAEEQEVLLFMACTSSARKTS